MGKNAQEDGCEIDPQHVGELFSIPWGHHRFIIDKCYSDPQKAWFFVRKACQNNWGRDMLLNFMDTDLYEREGKAISNFSTALPETQSDLAQLKSFVMVKCSSSAMVRPILCKNKKWIDKKSKSQVFSQVKNLHIFNFCSTFAPKF
ncbi:MAG: DUF1016 N-terminal domain-containing protein [Paludibacteraceae bacterium]|nr:DUF1016 N-terminal domain-containing protein [Paludibacteraceae bacterium]